MDNKCAACSEPHGEHFISEYFCTRLCKFLYAEGIGSIVKNLKEDESLISAFDHIQLLLKEEAQEVEKD